MLITTDELTKINGCNFNDGSLLNRKKLYNVILSKSANPMGDIVIFPSKAFFKDPNTQIAVNIDNGIHLFYSIPNISNSLMAIMFQRLFLLHLAQTLSVYIQNENLGGISLSGNNLCVEVEGKETPFTYSIIKSDDVNYVYYTGININTEINAYSEFCNTNIEDVDDVCTKINQMFYDSISELFVKSFMV